MTAPVLVTGGTGTLGRLVVPRLCAAGRDVRVLSRTPHPSRAGVDYVIGDISTGMGLEAAVSGVDTIVHLAGSAKGDDEKTSHLVRAALAGGRPHLVYISVVGADRIPIVSGIDRAAFGYYAAKLASERIIRESGLPFTILRATQFQESMLAVAKAMTRMPVVPTPVGSFQPIAAGEVADRLVELALGSPAGLVAEMGGPRTYAMADLMRDYLKATDRRRPILSVKVPGGASRALRAGGNLTPSHAVGRRTWEELLAEDAAGAGAGSEAGAGGGGSAGSTTR
ncbi:SDR family oxidoreductase [Leifsonia sp. NPDC058230]|uniref:SDR family oxidoreductase n=1 Tax=Leifsonia sp. NPDC058230 TaxID=3346391 RepID=UPI0036DCED56